MKKMFSFLFSLSTLAAIAQTRTQPVFDAPGAGFDKFMANHFRLNPLLHDTLATTAGTATVLFSFVITPEGRVDSLVFHECSHAGIKADVRHITARAETAGGLPCGTNGR